jgi:hypothetical protein
MNYIKACRLKLIGWCDYRIKLNIVITTMYLIWFEKSKKLNQFNNIQYIVYKVLKKIGGDQLNNKEYGGENDKWKQ